MPVVLVAGLQDQLTSAAGFPACRHLDRQLRVGQPQHKSDPDAEYRSLSYYDTGELDLPGGFAY